MDELGILEFYALRCREETSDWIARTKEEKKHDKELYQKALTLDYDNIDELEYLLNNACSQLAKRLIKNHISHVYHVSEGSNI